MSDVDLGILMKTRGHLKIAKHKPGNIKLKFGMSILSAVPELNTSEGRKAFYEIDGIDDVDINPLTFTLTVAYDEDLIAPELWDDLLEGDDAAADAAMERIRQMQG